MDGPRAPSEKEWPSVLAFLHENLRPESAWSLTNEYPTALTPANIHNIRIITEEQKVLSHAVLKPLIVKTPVTILKVGAIGSVVTDTNHRNQGLSRLILEDCLAEAKRQECDIAMLWTDLYDFYRKLNFELAGQEVSFVIDQEFTASEDNFKFIKGAQVSAEAIYKLYSQHTVSSIRTAEDIRKFLQIPNTHAYTAWDSSGQLAAYAVEGKGADLQNYIHEWGGSVTALTALFSFIRREKKTPFTVIMPAHSENLIRKLKAVTTVNNHGYLGMIKMINTELLFSKVKRMARAHGVSQFVLEKRGPEYLFGLSHDLIALTDEKDVVRLLFGPEPEIPHLKPETIQQLHKFLPLPLWIWGWDSV